MKEIFVSDDLEIANNLDAALQVVETLGDAELAAKVRGMHHETVKKHALIPFTVLTNKREVFPSENPVGKGDFIMLMIDFNTRKVLLNLWIDVVNKTITRVLTEV